MTLKTKTKSQPKQTRTISLRIPVEFEEYLILRSNQTGRTKSNYIKWLIQKEKEEKENEWKKQVKNTQNIGKKVFASNGLDLKKMTDEDAYNYFKNLKENE